MFGSRRLLAVVLAASMVVLVGCGDDDDDDAAEGGGDATTTTSAAIAPSAWCDDVARVQVIEPEVPEDAPPAAQEAAQEEFFQDEFLPLIDKIEREAPAAAKADVTAIATFFRDNGPAAFEDEAILPIEDRANSAAARACGAAETAVTAVDYQFSGAPAQLEAGYGLFRFTNEGAELHEMVLLKKKTSTTESFDELLELEQEEAEGKVDDVGFGFAFPGSDDTALVKLPAGDYLMVCFIPVGLTPEAAMAAEESGEEPEGPPHFTRGMRQEFRVA